ncbi:hypothetical protein AWB85_20315 [Mycobacteroides immunogenum]|uniref:Uncharacterized protein n=1 Tax=Mycobacteroides immunogenum TaxID=83262 RepID=A0A179VCS9_9MYCO|nr:hypothetical protein AWB85_20315 [Mycobacteroides immunogenum]
MEDTGDLSWRSPMSSVAVRDVLSSDLTEGTGALSSNSTEGVGVLSWYLFGRDLLTPFSTTDSHPLSMFLLMCRRTVRTSSSVTEANVCCEG